MNFNLPTALVGGVENFVAQKLIKVLLDKEMNVVGIGEEWPLEEANANFELVAQAGEVRGEVNYIFDFGKNEDLWKLAKKFEAKLSVILVNEDRAVKELALRLEKLGTNSRVVVLRGVYGPGMTGEGEEDPTIKALTEVLREAVENKNLTLPHPTAKWRLMNVDDAVEGVMRASFLSGTEGEVFELWGNEVEIRDIASELMDEAKMTRFKVNQKEMALEEVEEEKVGAYRSRLRWEPKIEFKTGLKEVLQDYFVKIDEEKRRALKKQAVKPSKKMERKGVYEVIVAEDQVEVKEEEREDFELAKFKVSGEEKEVKVWRKLKAEEVKETGSSIKWPKKEEAVEVKKTTTVKAPEIEEMVYQNESIKPDSLTKRIDASNKTVETKKEERKTRGGARWWFLGGLAGGVFLLGGLGFWLGSGLLAVKEVARFEELIKKKDYVQAALITEKGAEKLQNIDEDINDWGFNRIAILRNYQSGIRVAGDMLRLENRSVEAIKLGERLAESVLNEEEFDWERDWKKMGESVDELVIGMGGLQGRLEGNWSWLPSKWRNYPVKGIQKISELKENMLKISQSREMLPEMLGVDGKRREYLVLFQNENELRAGGGFIGSYGILSFEGGKLLNLEVKDIYEADGQLKGHVEPPEPIKTYLGEASWYMRDANWQADFKGSAKDIQWFLEKEVGRKVDGVIGINLAAAKETLGVVGEIYVPDFKEKVNKDNLYEQAEFYSETKFFPGSNQKASFLGGLSRQLFEEIKNLSTEKKGDLVVALLSLLDKNEVQLVINRAETAKIVADMGWDGGMYEGKCAQERCFADYLYVVESNLGVNKANYFIYRNMEQAVDISQTAVGRVLKITYENSAKSSNWPGGDYKNYMRIYIPQSSNVAEVSVSDGQGGGKKIYGGGELKVSQVKDKKELGFWMVVPYGQRRVVEVRYTDQISLGGEKQFSYLHYIQKQSGFGDTGLVALISFPAGWQPLQVEPAASLMSGKLLFNQRLDHDLRMGMEISK